MITNTLAVVPALELGLQELGAPKAPNSAIQRPDQNPTVYLAPLESAHSRRIMQAALAQIAQLVPDSCDPFALD